MNNYSRDQPWYLVFIHAHSIACGICNGYSVEPAFSSQPLLSGHSAIPQWWLFNTVSTVLLFIPNPQCIFVTYFFPKLHVCGQ